MKGFSQHGDVLAKPITKIPDGCKKVNHVCLAEGEGFHRHEIVTGDAVLYEKNGTFYLKAETDSVLCHVPTAAQAVEEHGPIHVTPGEYEIGIVQEYDHFREESRRVAD